jgi:hypothetical protein
MSANDDARLLAATILGLFEAAAEAWSSGRHSTARRLVAAAWTIADGCEFVDPEPTRPTEAER